MVTLILRKFPGNAATKWAVVAVFAVALFLILMVYVYPVIAPILFPPPSTTV